LIEEGNQRKGRMNPMVYPALSIMCSALSHPCAFEVAQDCQEDAEENRMGRI
jgi:hypothetical protein